LGALFLFPPEDEKPIIVRAFRPIPRIIPCEMLDIAKLYVNMRRTLGRGYFGDRPHNQLINSTA
jgi:hypothetical protein